jgi:hypothetical protein
MIARYQERRVLRAFCGEVDPIRRQKTRHAESWS